MFRSNLSTILHTVCLLQRLDPLLLATLVRNFNSCLFNSFSNLVHGISDAQQLRDYVHQGIFAVSYLYFVYNNGSSLSSFWILIVFLFQPFLSFQLPVIGFRVLLEAKLSSRIGNFLAFLWLFFTGFGYIRAASICLPRNNELLQVPGVQLRGNTEN